MAAHNRPKYSNSDKLAFLRKIVRGLDNRINAQNTTESNKQKYLKEMGIVSEIIEEFKKKEERRSQFNFQ